MSNDLEPGDEVLVRHHKRTRRLLRAKAGAEDARDMIWLGGQAYAHPSLGPLLAPVNELVRHPKNPRRGDQDKITDSVATSGLYGAVRVQDSTGHILAGNHTWQAVVDLGGLLIPRLHLDVDDDEALRILAKDNATSDAGTYDEAGLRDLLAYLAETEHGLTGSGYIDDDLAAMMEAQTAAELDALGEGDSRAPTTSEMLELVDVAWGEPDHQPHHGQLWTVGPHVLVLARVHTEHALWRDLLTSDGEEPVLFCPYPEPYLTTTEVATSHRLLLVQPNPFLAGHLLDKHASAHPGDTVRLDRDLLA